MTDRWYHTVLDLRDCRAALQKAEQERDEARRINESALAWRDGKEWVTKERDAAIRERDEAIRQVARLREALLATRQFCHTPAGQPCGLCEKMEAALNMDATAAQEWEKRGRTG